MLDEMGQKVEIFSQHMPGIDFYLDPSMLTVGSEFRTLLQDAIPALERSARRPVSPKT